MSSEFEIVFRTENKVHHDAIAVWTRNSPTRNISRCQANILAARLQSLETRVSTTCIRPCSEGNTRAKRTNFNQAKQAEFQFCSFQLSLFPPHTILGKFSLARSQTFLAKRSPSPNSDHPYEGEYDNFWPKKEGWDLRPAILEKWNTFSEKITSVWNKKNNFFQSCWKCSETYSKLKKSKVIFYYCWWPAPAGTLTFSLKIWTCLFFKSGLVL